MVSIGKHPLPAGWYYTNFSMLCGKDVSVRLTSVVAHVTSRVTDQFITQFESGADFVALLNQVRGAKELATMAATAAAAAAVLVPS